MQNTKKVLGGRIGTNGYCNTTRKSRLSHSLWARENYPVIDEAPGQYVKQVLPVKES